MADSYDLILKGGTVVNHDGEGPARYRHPRRAFRRHRRPVARLGRRGDRLPRAAFAAGRDRHPRPFSRARPDPQGRSGNRLARRGDRRRHRGVRNAEHRSVDHDAPRRWPTRSSAAHHRMHCDFAFYRRRDASTTPTTWASWSVCPAARRQGVHGLIHRLAAGRG